MLKRIQTFNKMIYNDRLYNLGMLNPIKERDETEEDDDPTI